MSTTSTYRRCRECDTEAPGTARFCIACGASLAGAPVETGLVRFAHSQFSLPDYLRQDLERRDQVKSLLADESGTGSGLVWIGLLVAAGSLFFTDLSGGALVVLGLGAVFVLAGFWRMRRHPQALGRAGLAVAVIGLVALGAIVVQAVGLQRPAGEAPIPALPVAMATPRADVAGSVSAPVPSQGGVAMFGATADHQGIQPGPGPVGRPSTRWRTFTGGEVYSSPVVAGDVVYLGTKSGFLAAYDRETGNERWRFDLGGYIVRATPAVVDGVAYIGAGYALYAIDVATGAEVWRLPMRYAGAASPTVAGGTVFIATQEGQIYAVAAADGALRWQREADGLVFGPPAVVDDVVYVVGEDGGIVALAADSGRLVWREQADMPVRSAPVVADGVVYVASAEPALLALAADSGDPIWRGELGGEGTPAITGGQLVFGSGRQGIYSLGAADGALRWLFPTGSAVRTAPALVDDVAYVGSGTTMYAIDLAAGEAQWSFPAGGEILTTAAVVDGTIYFGAKDGYLYAIGDG